MPTHNPDPGRLGRTLSALADQDLPPDDWELVLVDNASTDDAPFRNAELARHPGTRLVHEEQLGLTFARLRGIRESLGSLIVFVDDDNVLAAAYLRTAAALMARDPALGAAGGRVLPEFEAEPPGWVRRFDHALALRDPGNEALVARPFTAGTEKRFPPFAPIGAGMVLRREAALCWAEAVSRRHGPAVSDRKGASLASGGDNDIVLTLLENGWAVGYCPDLVLRHLIPRTRCTAEYLGRVLRESHRSWIAVLDAHGMRPRRPVPPLVAPALKARAWLRCGAWRGPVNRLRWLDQCGEIEGRSLLR